ncbi:macrophage migration inhibitory factor [Strongylocentrotus purpuratus]|uniref:L-dopachrome isomerase n=1 Tax=Strongylocentrotus purpuratus TaxID=7668 RepID=A0A7M7N4U5_STRPU|nr:macrophage migration inhibitory factor [Strongylocentrotus purpuratus]|eukprot:XP_001177764.2 PREDICTED: macrophage migration inhibitory factor [Strongylocentrotus purpuratus]
MPIIELISNVSSDSLPDGLMERTANFTAEKLGTPSKAVVVMIKHAVMFRFSSDEPCMLIKLECVDAFNDQEKNRKYSKEFIDYAAAEFSIPAQRINLMMENQSIWQIGLPDGRLLGDRMKGGK